MPPFYAVIDSGGNAVSFGTVLAEPLPAGLTAVDLGREPNFGVERWDAATRTLVPLPAVVVKDLLDDIMAFPEVLTLTAARQAALRTKLANRLATVEGRYYFA